MDERGWLAGLLLWLWLAGLPAAAAPARIVIAGDSTASAYGPERHPRQGWGQQLGSYLQPGIEVLNLAVSGRSTRDYVSLGHFAALAAELRAGDLLLVQFGHNDAKQDDPARHAEPRRDFPDGLRRFVDLARRQQATVVLLTPVARRSFDAAGAVVDTHGAYAEAVRTLARREGVVLLDLGRRSMDWLRELGPEASKAWYLHQPATGLADDTHFHQRGASAVACLVVAGLVEARLLDAADLARDADCGVPPDQPARRAVQARPSLLRHAELDTAVQPAPHGGSGRTIASPLFADQPDLALVVRRRVLLDGASIGLHAHGKDEIYYVLSGHGELTLDGVARAVGPGHAVLTRDGSSHSLRQVGSEPLAILVVYARPPAP